MKKFMILSAFQVLVTVPMIAGAAYGSVTVPSRGQTPLTTIVQNEEKENLVSDLFSRTLYTFDLDIGSTTSKCDGACAEIWPAVILDAKEAATLQAPLGVITRSGKNLQLTFDGKPVYTYAFDRTAGDDHGDGIGGVWHYIEIK